MAKKQSIKSELATLAKIRKNHAARMRRYRARLKAKRVAKIASKTPLVVAQDGEIYPASDDDLSETPIPGGKNLCCYWIYSPHVQTKA